LTQIKNKIGASFVAWESCPINGNRLKIKFSKEEPQYVELKGGINNIDATTYIKLLEQL